LFWNAGTLQPQRIGRSVLGLSIFLGVLTVTSPLWLPESIGGDISFQFILTGSMKGELDPGSFVVLRRSETYDIGDVAGYRLYGQDGGSIVIVHRVVDRLPDGRYIFKGDANLGTEVVGPDQVIGKMVVGVPWAGLVPAVIRSSPVIAGIVLLVPLIVFRSKGEAAHRQKKSLFLVSLLVVALTMPFYSVGLAEKFGALAASGMIIGFLGGIRSLEVKYPLVSLHVLVDLSYIFIAAQSMMMVSIPEATDSLKLLVGEFKI